VCKTLLNMVEDVCVNPELVSTAQNLLHHIYFSSRALCESGIEFRAVSLDKPISAIHECECPERLKNVNWITVHTNRAT
jgi:hypothetical protein